MDNKYIMNRKYIMSKKNKIKWLAGIALIFIIVLAVSSAEEPEKMPLMPEGVFDFPSLYIFSELEPFEAERGLWHRGRMAVRGTSSQYLFENVPVKLRGRGNSSWVRGPEKRPLRLRFYVPRAMLDSEHKAQDWVLIANLFDMSLLRNYAAFYLAGLLDGIYWSPFSRFVHLYINNDYAGVYQVADERDIGPGRADLIYHEEPELSEYLFEMDGSVRYWTEERGGIEDIDFFAVDDRAFRIRFPKADNQNGHLEYLREFTLNADRLIRSHDYQAVASVIDIESMIDYYIIMELFKNIDVGSRSIFLQLKGQGEDRRMYFGPVWDFDRSAGNTLYWTEARHIFAGHYNMWFKEMLEMPEMVDLITERWNQIKDNEIEDMIISTAYLAYNYQEAFERNFLRHGHILGGEPRWFEMLPEDTIIIDTFRGQADYLISWLDERVMWLDDYFNRPN